MSLTHAVTQEPMEPSKITCGDGTYTMYPDNAQLWFQRISFNGENLLFNGDIGKGIFALVINLLSFNWSHSEN